MTEETPQAQPETPQPEAPKSRVYDLIQSLKGGKTDPLMALLMLSELRRMERDEERWLLERQRLTQNPSKEVDIEKLVDKLNQSWEARFQQYQSNLEKLLLGKKVEEAEERALRLEKELKETKEKMELDKLFKEKVEEALTPYKEQISQLQQLLASKTAGMTENERRGFFQSLGEQIEQSLSQEVTGTIAKNIADAIMKAFTPKEEEVPVTAEGKVDTYRMVDKWVRKGLDAIKTLAERWPTSKPPIREVQKLPVTTTPQPTIAGVSAPATQQTATIAPPATSTTATPPTPTVTTTTPPETQHPKIKEEKPPEKEEGEKPVEKTEEPKETGAEQTEPSEKATGKRAKRKEP